MNKAGFWLSSIFFVFYLASLSFASESPGFNLTILFTGDQIGYLEPCGCADEQLGGLSRRHSFIEELRRHKKNLLLLDNGDRAKGIGRQEELKYETTLYAMAPMGYDAMNMGERDLFLGLDYINYTKAMVNFPQLSANLSTSDGQRPFSPFTIKSFKQDGSPLRVAVVGLISKSLEQDVKAVNPSLIIQEPEETLRELLETLEGKSDLIVVLAHATLEEVRGWARAYPSLNIIIFSHSGEDPYYEPIREGDAVLLFSGNQGRYMGQLDLSLVEGKIKEYKLHISPLGETVPSSPFIEALLTEYQGMLKVENILAKVSRKSLDGMSFVSSEQCGQCHKKEEEIWSQSKHAQAYKTLEQKNHHYDPECVHCHTTGFGFKSGFEGPDVTPHLAHVGCESCHGAGSAHLENPQGKDAYGKATEKVCLSCHEGDNSPHFDFKTYWPKIKH